MNIRTPPEPDFSYPLNATYLEVPAPPSVNAMFRDGGRGKRPKTKAYIDWSGHAGWRLNEQNPRKVAGPYILFVSIDRISSTSDIDNRIKGIVDLLVKHKVVDDDKNMVSVTASWAPAADKVARVLIIPAGDLSAEFHLAKSRVAGGWMITTQLEQEQ